MMRLDLVEKVASEIVVKVASVMSLDIVERVALMS